MVVELQGHLYISKLSERWAEDTYQALFLRPI